jgi:UDP-glucuronate 4-epimerase
MKILVTGTAGFIGYHLTKKLAAKGHIVVGLDIINDYYDINLKYARLANLGFDKINIEYNQLINSGCSSSSKILKDALAFVKLDLNDKENLSKLFKSQQFEYVINLAAQAGVRYSITNPHAYMESNILGFLNILEACRHNNIKHLVYASSSSVYGLNEAMPFSVHHNVDHPVSLYAASKKSNELMAHTYSHLYDLPTTGLRFFTVYGPWGRPDMALFIFTKAILENKPIDVYNHGRMQRDFTYIDDIVEGIIRVTNNLPKENNEWSGLNPDPGTSPAPYKIYNIGNNAPVKLLDFIDAIENALGKKASKNMMPIQPGDVPSTYADVSDLINNVGYKPSTPIQQGINHFIKWFKEYYKID